MADLAPPTGPVSAIPVQLTRFIGRGSELNEIRELLGSTRLLTLTGPGGSGKTRLALETAGAVEHAGGSAVLWVELAALMDPALVAGEIAATLRLIEEPGRPLSHAIVEFVGRHRTLLVLDNCEHVVETCAVLSDQLLRACPQLTILATSREALGVAGETAWLVPPLSLPPLGEATTPASLERSEAVTLFAERARAVMPGFAISETNAAAVADICRRLDGIPLAIELAAARVKVLTPAQIRERLDDCFALLVQRGRTALPRHQTIRAAIDWSYELLPLPERLLLQRLSVFAGGFTLESAERVCGGSGIEDRDVFNLVAALVERSLVLMEDRGDSARYRLLEVVRQYAAECLAMAEAEAESGAASAPPTARRHAEWSADFADTVGASLDVLQSPEAMDRVAAEHDNLRAALEWSLLTGERLLALRISGALWPYWLHGTHWSDGLEWMNRVLDGAGTGAATAPLGRALLGAGSLAHATHDLLRARDWWERADQVWRELSSPRELALVHEGLAQLQMHLGDAAAAVSHAEYSVRCAREWGDPYVLAYSLATGLGFVHAFRGEGEIADGFCAEAQEIALREGYQWGILVASFSRAMTAWMHGNAEAAASHGLACVRAARGIDSPWFGPRVLLVPAGVAAHVAEPARAARLLGACHTLQASSRGGRLLAVEQPFFDRIAEMARHALDAESFTQAWAEGGALTLEAALAEAEAAASAAALAAPTAIRAEPPRAVNRQAKAPEAPPPDSPHGSALRVFALGPLEIFRGDELLGTERWSYAKPRELLLFLLCNPAGVTKEQIGQAIWPEATPSQLRNNLHVTLHYVRKALGSTDWIVYAEDRYRLDRRRGVEFDLERFEAEVAAIVACPEAAEDSRVKTALALYRGDFLASEMFGRWRLDWRDRALQGYVALLSLLAERCFARTEYAEAKRLYQQVVAREELREDLQRRLMQCLARTGERAQALRHGERLVNLLRDELDAEPEPETAELCERLRRAERV